MAGDVGCSGTEGKVRAPAGPSIASATESPRTSNGIWICDSLSVAASTGTGRPPAFAELTRAPSMLKMVPGAAARAIRPAEVITRGSPRSEEHTSELQSHVNLVCRLLLEKKKIKRTDTNNYT